MADYAKISVKGLFSKSSDYSDPKASFSPEAFALTPDEYIHMEKEFPSVLAAGNYVTTNNFNEVTLLLIKNRDATNFVKVTFTTTDVASNIVRVPPGGILSLPGITASTNFIVLADTAPCECEILITGT